MLHTAGTIKPLTKVSHYNDLVTKVFSYVPVHVYALVFVSVFTLKCAKMARLNNAVVKHF